MGRILVRRHGEAATLQRRTKWWTSMGSGALMVVIAGAVGVYESLQPMAEPYFSTSNEGHMRRLESFEDIESDDIESSRHLRACVSVEDTGDRGQGFWDDPIIPMKGTPPRYKNAGAARWGIIVHVIVVAYMLLGLNTVCDLYFTGALDELVKNYEIAPDVAGATFMAAGGSAPELFTSLIGAVVTENDVGFGTIVGSAVFNVLAVIGACGISALKPIPLSWWPLFRDCVYYIIGLGLLAAFSYGKAEVCDDGHREGGGSVNLVEAIILFLAYIVYCVIMYFNRTIMVKCLGFPPDDEEESDKNAVLPLKETEETTPETQNAKSDGDVTEFQPKDQQEVPKINLIESTETSGLRSVAQTDSDDKPPGQPEHHKGAAVGVVDQTSPVIAVTEEKKADKEKENRLTHAPSLTVPGMVGNPGRIPSNNSGQARKSSRNDNHHKPGEVHSQIRVNKNIRVVCEQDGEVHKVVKSPRPDNERRHSKEQVAKVKSTGTKEESKKDSDDDKKKAENTEEDPPDTKAEVKDGDGDGEAQDGDDDDDIEALMTRPQKREASWSDDIQYAEGKFWDEIREILVRNENGKDVIKSCKGAEMTIDDIQKMVVEDWPALFPINLKIEAQSDFSHRLELVQWYLSLPIYAPLYYGIPRPDGKCGFIPSFILSLVFIAGFSFLLVYCVELFGKAILGGGNNVTIIMSFTLLAAGTSIPDLVSSMAVARSAQGDMAVSSSIGSNIFDILVGLPVPWMIKIIFVDMVQDGKSYEEAKVHIKSPYIALYVILLLFMVFCVILSIHMLKWHLNFQLGLCMAVLYVVFLAIVLPVELINKGPYI